MIRRSVCLLALALLGVGASLPSGWIYIEQEGIDTFPGAYHDRLSGTYVNSEVALPGVAAPWAESAARAPGAKRERSDVGPLRRDRVKLLPTTKGCSQVSVTFTDERRKGLLWNLAADLCSTEQERRFDELIEDLSNSGWPAPNARAERWLTMADFDEIKPGMVWEDLRRRLGPPGAVKRQADGFEVGYEVKGGEMLLAFDRQHHLRSMRRRGR